jgi:endonuclease G
MYLDIYQKNVSRYTANNDGSLSPSSQYPNDPDLASEYRLTADPYKYNGFDHGHICPSADRLSSFETNYQTFYITNMQPQYMNFNGSNRDPSINQRSPWYRLEDRVRTWASSCDTLYVCKGGTIDKSEHILQYLTDKIVGKNKIPVPKYFFVAIFGKKGTTYKAVGFWMEHLANYESQISLSIYAKSIDELEELTGIDFFCNLPDNIEDAVEKSYSPSDWSGNLK